MAYNWTRKKREINGETRLVKVRTRDGKEQVRLVGYRNTVDKTAKKSGLKRIKGVYSSTDGGSKRRRIVRSVV